MVLVTGGTGLVGAHLLLHLTENEVQVKAIYRNFDSIQKTKSLFNLYNKKPLFENIQWIQADITDIPSLENAFHEIRLVYHCAALISFDPTEEEKLRKINIEGTANIVNLCLSRNVKKLCYISSIAALGDLAPNQTIITEETEWNPEKSHSDYAISKYGAEMEIWRGKQEGLDIIILNPGVILGPGFPNQGMGLLYKKVEKGLSFYTLGSTGFVAVPDVIKVAFELMKTDLHINQRFTIIGQNCIYREVLNSMAVLAKAKKPSFHATPFIMEFLWRMDWIFSAILRQKTNLPKSTAKASYAEFHYSNDKIKAALNFEFLDVHDYITKNYNL